MTKLSNVLFIDTESTGLDPATAEVIEVGVAYFDDETYRPGSWTTMGRLYRPLNGIPPEAAAVNDITEDMVSDALTLAEAGLPEVAGHTGYVASHNAAYDRALLLANLGDAAPASLRDDDRWICTLRLARHVVPELPKHGLQYLRHALMLPVNRDVAPHRARNDALVGAYLLDALTQLAIAGGQIDPAGDITAQIAALAQSPIPITAWPFGKHQGTPLARVPTDYLEWAILNLDAFKEGTTRYDADLVAAVVEEMGRRMDEAA